MPEMTAEIISNERLEQKRREKRDAATRKAFIGSVLEDVRETRDISDRKIE